MKTIILLLGILSATVSIGQVKNLGGDLFMYQNPPQKENCVPEIKFDPTIHENVPTGTDFSAAASFDWPFVNGLNVDAVIVNYVDNLSGSSIKDYMGNTWSYNGHRGTDVSLHDFRNMDRFVSVVAAEAGTVMQIEYDNFDRNTGWDSSPANLVLIRHADGSYAYYYHLMKKSVTVRVGEWVQKGSLIGFIGSAGNSTDAHLHFEPGYFVDGEWNKRDPWHGTYNTLPTMWASQYGYVATDEINVMDMGVYTAGLVGGNIDDPGPYLKERIIQPNTVSGYEPDLGMWVQLQGHYTGKQVKFEIRKPNGTLYTSTSFYINEQIQYGWYWWTPAFDVGVSETGNWYARVLYDNVEQMRDYFNVQLLTSNRPRMYPVAGKCFRRTGSTQRDTLRVRPVRTNMEYQLISAPPNVSIVNDSILTIGIFNQPYRVEDFRVIASMGGSSTLRDTMIYKLIDTTKSYPLGNGIESLNLTAKIEGRWNGFSMKADTIVVQVRAPLSPYSLVEAEEVYLNTNGSVIVNFQNVSNSVYYYLAVKHRNSIETWSKTTMQFTSGFPISYDFTTAKTKAYGDNLKLKLGDYCIYSGDVNQDGVIDGVDISIIDNDVSIFGGGYSISDLDGDLFVDATDLAIADNNAYSYVTRIRP